MSLSIQHTMVDSQKKKKIIIIIIMIIIIIIIINILWSKCD